MSKKPTSRVVWKGPVLVWLSYDLGLRGDYESLYTWLDGLHAKECGSNVAVFTYGRQGEDLTIETLAESIERDLEKNEVKLQKTDRLYISSRGIGRFIAGRRKRAPWEGYAGTQTEADTEDSV